MILGMSTSMFTLLHVAISLIAILAGLIVAYEMLRSKPSFGWTLLFLSTTVLTSVTGFMFPLKAIGPPHIVGAISLVVLTFTLLGVYVYRLAGAWRWIYVIGALLSLYLNVFVGVVQAFQKIPALNVFAPTQTEGAFVAAQSVVLLLFVALTIAAVKRFHPVATPIALVANG
jgi:hypothetical protein